MVHSDESVGWSGFLSYRCGVVIENVIYIIDYLNRQPLWNFVKAAFPRARYCLSSATLTDAYVKDILSKTLPKALRTQALTALTSNFGLVGLVRKVWLGRFGLVGLVW